MTQSNHIIYLTPWKYIFKKKKSVTFLLRFPDMDEIDNDVS